jgi:hypothetical protein
MRIQVALISGIAVLGICTGVARSQAKEETRNVVVNGRRGQVQVLRVNGKEYMDIAAVVNITQGSLAFQSGQMVITVPPSDAGNPAPPSTTTSDPNALSREFMKAGIEEMTLLREWASPLANAIENGFPINDQWVSGYRANAGNGLRLASVAVATPADKNALELLSNEFQFVDQWSKQLLEEHKSMDTAKYTMSKDTLKNEPQSQKIISCGHYLESMLASGTFQDDGSCR